MCGSRRRGSWNLCADRSRRRCTAARRLRWLLRRAGGPLRGALCPKARRIHPAPYLAAAGRVHFPGHSVLLRLAALVAAVSAALAEELGTDITGIRIVSMKKM